MKIFLPLMLVVFLSGCIGQSEVISPYEDEAETPSGISTEPAMPLAPIPLPQLPLSSEPLPIPINTTEDNAEFSELYELVKNGSYMDVKNLRDIKTTAKLIFADSWHGGAKYENYFFHAPLGSNDKWVKVVINDGTRNNLTVDTLVINEAEIKTSTVNLKIFIADVRALADGTVVGADLWISP